MTVEPSHEAPQPQAGAGFSDAVTFSFGDPVADVFGVARVGLSEGAEPGTTVASGLAMLFAGGEPTAVRAAGGLDVDRRDWEAIDAAGIRTTTERPLGAWTIAFTDDDGAAGFDLRYEARSTPAEIAAGTPAAKLGGMQGYEQLCRVTGTVRTPEGEHRVDCLGQRGHSWGAPDWDRIELARTVGAWLDEDLGVSLTTIRPAGEDDHASEAIAAFVMRAGAEDDLAVAVPIADPRLSTTYDADDRQRRAGLELYIGEEDPHPLRGAGEVVCGTTLDLGRLRLDAAFFTWRMEGRTGVGRYDVLRRT